MCDGGYHFWISEFYQYPNELFFLAYNNLIRLNS
uniref:Uncharacterized protein n=1 Tax=Rhizophora mucronata TaxID=61149 RepID=A0A2P2IV57_RHIMU